MKQQSGKYMPTGSGDIVSQFTQCRLIDEYQILMAPFVIGKEKAIFVGMKDTLAQKPTKTRTFGNGNVLLHNVQIK